MRDIDRLLVAYKQLAATKQSKHLRHLRSASHEADQMLPGRFAHCASTSLTLDNVQAMLTEYQRLQSAA